MTHVQGLLLDKAGDALLPASLPGAACAAKAAGCGGQDTCSGGCCQGKVGQVIGIIASGFGGGGAHPIAGWVHGAALSPRHGQPAIVMRRSRTLCDLRLLMTCS